MVITSDDSDVNLIYFQNLPLQRIILNISASSLLSHTSLSSIGVDFKLNALVKRKWKFDQRFCYGDCRAHQFRGCNSGTSWGSLYSTANKIVFYSILHCPMRKNPRKKFGSLSHSKEAECIDVFQHRDGMQLC